MNKKLVAIAVAGAVGTPMLAAAQTSDGVQIYGRINTAVDLVEQDYQSYAAYLDAAGNVTSRAAGTPGNYSPGADRETVDLSTISSRLGIRYDKDIGFGMAVHGRYEFSAVTDREADSQGDALSDVRIASVGFSGDFGRVDMGNLWSAYFNTVGTLISPTYTMGAMVYATIGDGPFRSSNTIKYTGEVGPVNFQFDWRLRDEGSDGIEDGTGQVEALNSGYGFGVTFSPMDRLTLAVAYDNEQDVANTGNNLTLGEPLVYIERDTSINPNGVVSVEQGRRADAQDVALSESDDGGNVSRLGLAASYSFDRANVTVGWQMTSDDELSFGYGLGANDRPDPSLTNRSAANFDHLGSASNDHDSYFINVRGDVDEQTSWLVGYSEGEGISVPGSQQQGSAVDSDQLIVGLYHHLGGGLRLYYEGTQFDNQNAGYEQTQHLFGMRLDF